MPRFGGKEYTWFGILRFPILMGSVLTMGAYMTLNFKTLFRGNIDDRLRREREVSNRLFDNSSKSRDK